jgi:16S rRNA (cytosine967-C5)-methyltransferase
MPDWLVDVLFARYGEDHARDIARWANAIPHLYLRLAKDGPGLERLNQLLEDAHLHPARPHHEFVEYALVETSALVPDSPILKEPLGWVQNPAAGLVVRLLDPQIGEEVLDLFAAPGGKSLAIAEAVGPEGKVYAVDRNSERLRRLIENKARFAADNIIPIQGDVAQLHDRKASRILADAPFSALGTLPKNPEVRWTKTPADVERLARSQRIWLAVAAKHVTPGGVLVYSTCTITAQENEDVVQDFLDTNPDFALEDAKQFVPERYVTSGGCLATAPPIDGLDGVFAARFRRASGSPS